MKKTLFCLLIGLFITICASSFIQPVSAVSLAVANKTNGHFFGRTYWVFDNTFIGYYKGCRMYATGVITFQEDGSYNFSSDFTFRADCYFNTVSAQARVNAERTEVINSSYMDVEREQQLSVDESTEMDQVVLTMVQDLEE